MEHIIIEESEIGFIITLVSILEPLFLNTFITARKVEKTINSKLIDNNLRAYSSYQIEGSLTNYVLLNNWLNTIENLIDLDSKSAQIGIISKESKLLEKEVKKLESQRNKIVENNLPLADLIAEQSQLTIKKNELTDYIDNNKLINKVKLEKNIAALKDDVANLSKRAASTRKAIPIIESLMQKLDTLQTQKKAYEDELRERENSSKALIDSILNFPQINFAIAQLKKGAFQYDSSAWDTGMGIIKEQYENLKKHGLYSSGLSFLRHGKRNRNFGGQLYNIPSFYEVYPVESE